MQQARTGPPTDSAERRREIEELYRRYSAGGRRRSRWRRLLWGIWWAAWLQLLNGIKRVLDALAAGLLLTALAPVLLTAYLLARGTGGGVERSPTLGKWATEFPRYSLRFGAGRVARWAQFLHARQLPVLFNILRGDMSFVGPRAIVTRSASGLELAGWKRYNVRPGLICLWWIRERTNIAYASETEVDLEYVDTHSLWGDLGITLRAVPAMFYGQGMATAPDRISILGIRIDNLTMREALDFILARIREPHLAPARICFLNADCANLAWGDRGYSRVLEGADLALADGIGLQLAAKMLARDLRQNVNGTDLFPRLCELLEQSGRSLYLLGGRPGVAAAVAGWIGKHHPGVTIKGFQHGYFSADEEEVIVGQIAASGADILLVAFGAPRQEKWIERHLGASGVRVALGVGGLFDFYSGRIPRAPLWLREMGLEWLYRFWQEPRRMWKRYFRGNVVFLFRVMQERLGHFPHREDRPISRRDLIS